MLCTELVQPECTLASRQSLFTVFLERLDHKKRTDKHELLKIMNEFIDQIL